MGRREATRVAARPWRWAMAAVRLPGRVVGVAMHAFGRFASLVWRSLFVTAAALCGLGGVLMALGREGDSYAAVLVAAALAAVATGAGLLALRVEPMDESEAGVSP